MKTSETKKFVKIFLRDIFDFLQNILHPGLIFTFIKGLFKFPSSED
jgi:hypothetical protein